MEQRVLGEPGRGPQVSALCLGTMYFGTLVDEDTAFAILDRFLDAGGTFLDTANCYSFWVDGGTGEESERLLGRWLHSRRARDRVVLASKVGSRPEPPGASWPEHAEGLSAPVIRAQTHASLRRLGTNRIDVYYAHIDDPATPQEETLGAFAELVAQGLVGTLGCSNHTAARVEQARRVAREHGWPGYRCVQQRYTYLRPRPGADFHPQVAVDDALLNLVRAEPDLTLLAYSPLLSGAYTRDDRPLPEQYVHAGNLARLAALREVAAELGATPNQVVLAWLLGGHPPVLPVIGVSSVAQLDEALGALDLKLDPEQRRRLDAA